MENNRCLLTPFTAEEPRTRARATNSDSAMRAWKRKREAARTRTGSMLAKIAICMAILLAVVAIQAFALQDGGWAVEASTSEDNAQTEQDDVLGRLRFVAAGGVKSVFAVSQRWTAPVTVKDASLINDDTLLCISAKAGDRISMPAMGEVQAISTDAALGDYVRVSHGNDLESVYYHLDDVRVEQGQLLQVGDVLGKVASDGVLYVAILQTGARIDPTEYLDVLGG